MKFIGSFAQSTSIAALATALFATAGMAQTAPAQSGPPGPRANARAERRSNRQVREIVAASDEPRPASPDESERAVRARKLRQQLAEIEARIVTRAEPPESCFD